LTFVIASATTCAGLFAGAALYVNLVEHPARLSCGTEFATREFEPSYRRAAVLQAALALLGLAAGIYGFVASHDGWILTAAVLLGSVVPYTLIAVMPTNRLILHPALESSPPERMRVLIRWGRLHAVRTVLGIAAFLVFLWRL